MRPTDRFENWFITSLQTGINDTTSSFRLNDNLNVSQARLVIDPYDESIREVVKVTSVDGNLVYVERGDDNTTPQYHLEGAIVALNVVAADMNDLYADFEGVVDATDAANQAASDANSAASDASSAASDATTATGLANTATSNANAATSAANSAAGSANSAASSANTAAGNAQDAADNAQGIVDDVAGAVDDGILPIHTDKVNNRIGINKVPGNGRVLDILDDAGAELRLSSKKKATIVVEADTDNVDETDVASIKLIQDGGAVTGSVGFGVDSQENDLVIRNDYASGDIHLDTGGGLYSNGVNLMPESGSNSRGSWTKFPDGTLIQRCSLTPAYTTSDVAFGAYNSPTRTITFPIPFAYPPDGFYGSTTYVYGRTWMGLMENETTTTVNFRLMSMRSDQQGKARIVAYGRWK